MSSALSFSLSATLMLALMMMTNSELIKHPANVLC
jgi:hypothetical protein